MILATAPDSKAIGILVDGLAVDGKLVIVGASAEPFAVSSLQLIGAQRNDWDGRRELQRTRKTRSSSRRPNGSAPDDRSFPLDWRRRATRNDTGKVRFRSVLMH